MSSRDSASSSSSTRRSTSLRVLLPRILAEIKLIIEEHTGEASQGCRRELVHSLFSNIAENVGDAEKEYVMRWWEENRDHLGGHDEAKTGPEAETAVLTARL